MTFPELEAEWLRCSAELGATHPTAAGWQDLARRYTEPRRAYHTLQHLEECFSWLNQTRSLAEHPGEVAFALFFHDAVYDTHASDNEDLSATLALETLRRIAANADSDRIKALILATKHDACPEGGDARLLVDIDLSILGASAARFDEYERQVRQEYAWVADDAFRSARRKVLEHFLARPTIYNLAFFRERLEATARNNLARSLTKLAS